MIDFIIAVRGIGKRFLEMFFVSLIISMVASLPIYYIDNIVATKWISFCSGILFIIFNIITSFIFNYVLGMNRFFFIVNIGAYFIYSLLPFLFLIDAIAPYFTVFFIPATMFDYFGLSILFSILLYNLISIAAIVFSGLIGAYIKSKYPALDEYSEKTIDTL